MIAANFGTEHAEHILVLRGDTDDEHFLKVTEQCIGKGAHPPPSNVIHRYPLQTICLFSLSGGDETCWRCGPPTEGEQRQLCAEHQKQNPIKTQPATSSELDLLIFPVKNTAETSRLRVPVSPRNETFIRDF